MNAGMRYAEVQIVPAHVIEDAPMMAELTNRLAVKVVDRIHDDGHEVAGDVEVFMSDCDPAFWPAPEPSRWSRLLVALRLRKPAPPFVPPSILRVEVPSRASRRRF